MISRAMPWALGLGMIWICGTASAQQIEELETEYEADVEYGEGEQGLQTEQELQDPQMREQQMREQQMREQQMREQQLREQQRQMELQTEEELRRQQELELQQQQPMPEPRIEAEYEPPPPARIEAQPMARPEPMMEGDPFGVQESGQMGVALSIGGGVVGFTDDEARDFADVGGSWDARLGLGLRGPIGAEVAYIGSANNIEAIGLDDDAILVSNGAEAVARLNLIPEGVANPYLFGGIGWRNYALVNEDFNTSSVQDNDNVGHVPLGVGVGFRVQEVLIDVRGVARPTFEADMMGGGGTELHTLTGEARAGFEF